MNESCNRLMFVVLRFALELVHAFVQGRNCLFDVPAVVAAAVADVSVAVVVAAGVVVVVVVVVVAAAVVVVVFAVVGHVASVIKATKYNYKQLI